MPENEEVPVAVQERKFGTRKMVIIIVIVLALIVTMVGALLVFIDGTTDTGGVPRVPTRRGDTILKAIPEPFIINLLPDAVDVMTISVTLEVSPRERYGKNDVVEELATLTEDNADKTMLPLVTEKIGMVLASKTKEEYLSDVGIGLIKDKIRDELNKILVKSKVERVIFPKPPIIQ